MREEEAFSILILAIAAMGVVVLVVALRLDILFSILERVLADVIPHEHLVAWLTALATVLLLGAWLAIRNRTSETDPAVPGAVRESSSAQRFRPSRRPLSPISGAHRSEVYR
jgi:H+/Cl- antiporter ClcA